MNNLQTEISHLLIKTEEICRRFEEVEKTTGAGFNLLHLLNMGHYEAKTHTPILTDLLNPQGSHGQGDVFLKLFLTVCFEKDLGFMSKASGIVVTEEKYIGRVNSEQASGGRIDIFLESSQGELLAIENKIYANEQDQQLQRYLNYVSRAKENGRVIYLTLDGQEPGSIKGNKPEILSCISYQSHIVDWLRLCRKEVTTIPTIRESLTIYINLICELTNQSPNQEMNKEIMESVLESPSSLAAYLALPKENEIQQSIFDNKVEEIKRIAKEHSLGFSLSEKKVADQYFGFNLKSESWSDFWICFNFDSANCKNLLFGFQDDGRLIEEERQTLNQMVSSQFGESTVRKTKMWPACPFWTKYRNWHGETLSEVAYGSFLEDLEEQVATFKKLGDEFARTTH
ncbi:MAG: PD-(D/E)XK nuclease family protein [Roseibacillus sp.]